jgi:hypothetical protein
MGLSRRLVRAVAGRGPRRYRAEEVPDPLPRSMANQALEPRLQVLLDLWGGEALPLQVLNGEEARQAVDSADQVCKSFS